MTVLIKRQKGKDRKNGGRVGGDRRSYLRLISKISQNKGKERENSYQKLKERHTQTHGNLFKIFC